MLDIRFVRENPEIVKENIKKKFQDAKLPLVDEVIALDAKRRAAIAEADQLRADRNRLSKQVGMLMGQAKKDPSKLEEAEAVKAQVKEQADRLAELERQEALLQAGEAYARLDAALAGDAWVMDGNYLRTLPRRLERCDAVLFLDYPRRLCLFRALRRILRWRGRPRPDMAEGCPERLDPAFIRWIWDFHRTQRPRVLELLDGWKGEAHIFRSPAQCAAFLAQQKNQNTPGME